MFGSIYNKFVQSTFFEKLFLFILVIIGIVGLWIINKLFIHDKIPSWDYIAVLILWILLIFVLVLLDIIETINKSLLKMSRGHLSTAKLNKSKANAPKK